MKTMKKHSRTVLSVLLAVLMLFSLLPVSAVAEPDEGEEPATLERNNGPLTPEVNMFMAQFTFLKLVELNEDGTNRRDENKNDYAYYFFRNELGLSEDPNEPDFPAPPVAEIPDGAAYDLATNTLTLTDFDGGRFMLSANMMGDDFTIRVEGDCRLGVIYVWGDGWGAGLRIAGTGTLTVDENKLFDSAVEIHPEETAATFRLDKEASVKLCGRKNAVSILGTTQEEDLYDLPDGAGVEPVKETFVNKERQELIGYVVDPEEPGRETTYPLCTCADDPDGIYTILETPVWPADGDPYEEVQVQHLFYSEKYHIYLPDFDPDDGSDMQHFADLAEAKAAGYEKKLDENGEPVIKEIAMPGAYGFEFVQLGEDGKEYVSVYAKLGENKYGSVIADIEPLPGAPDRYLFIPRRDLGVDPDTLPYKYVDVMYDDLWTWSIPGGEFIYDGAQKPAEKKTVDRIDVDILTDRIPWGEKMTPEAMFELVLDHLIVVKTPGVYMQMREIREDGTGKYQTLPITANKLFSDKPFDTFANDTDYEIVLTFGNSFDEEAGMATVFADEVSLYVNGEKADAAAPLAEDRSEMVTKGMAVLSAGKFRSPADETTLPPETEPSEPGTTLPPETEPSEPGTTLPPETEPFEPGTTAPAGEGFTLGDVNMDGKINSSDARLALRAAAKTEKLSELQTRLADVSEDGKVKASDARTILRIAAKLEPKPTKTIA